MRGLSLVAASRGHSSSRCAGLSLSRPLLLQSTGSRRAGSVIVAHGPSWSAACGILPDQGSNPCPLHWQADSQPLRHQGSPYCLFKNLFFKSLFLYSFAFSQLPVLLYECNVLPFWGSQRAFHKFCFMNCLFLCRISLTFCFLVSFMLQMFDSDLTNQMEEWSNMKLIGISVSRQGSSAGELCIRVGS